VSGIAGSNASNPEFMPSRGFSWPPGDSDPASCLKIREGPRGGPVEPAEIPTYSGRLRGDHLTECRRAGAVALCFVAVLAMGVASAHAQQPNPDPAPVPPPAPAPAPQPAPAPSPQPAPPPAAPPAASSERSSPTRAAKRKAAKRKKSVERRRLAAVHSTPREAPAATASVVPIEQTVLSEPGSSSPVPAELLAWLVIGIGSFLLVTSVVLVMSGRWER
jgi:hypothetical protein